MERRKRELEEDEKRLMTVHDINRQFKERLAKDETKLKTEVEQLTKDRKELIDNKAIFAKNRDQLEQKSREIDALRNELQEQAEVLSVHEKEVLSKDSARLEAEEKVKERELKAKQCYEE